MTKHLDAALPLFLLLAAPLTARAAVDQQACERLCAAAANADLGRIAALVRGGAPLECRGGVWEMSPLAHAVSGGRWNERASRYTSGPDTAARLKAVTLLLAEGADVNGADGLALAEAIRWDQASPEIVKTLLEAGADPNSPNDESPSSSSSPILLATDLLSSPSMRQTGEAIVKLLLARGAVPNVASRSGSRRSGTPLHFAARAGSIVAVRALLEHGANPNDHETIPDYYPGTPLADAAFELGPGKDRFDVIQALVEYGADVNKANFIDGSPLHLAARAGDVRVVRYLLARGANPRSTDHYGLVPLQRAVEAVDRARQGAVSLEDRNFRGVIESLAVQP